MSLPYYLKLEPKEKDIPKLTKSLRSYGLRPDEWVVRHETGNLYRIENIEAPEFFFEGFTKEQGRQQIWKKIYLKNL